MLDHKVPLNILWVSTVPSIARYPLPGSRSIVDKVFGCMPLIQRLSIALFQSLKLGTRHPTGHGHCLEACVVPGASSVSVSSREPPQAASFLGANQSYELPSPMTVNPVSFLHHWKKLPMIGPGQAFHRVEERSYTFEAPIFLHAQVCQLVSVISLIQASH